jgi:PIN domain nuclease of toxin-antitoxin system
VRLLLDTHAFLWFVAGDARLSRRARRALEDSHALLFLSAASVWEMAIKVSLGRLTLPSTAAEYIAAKIQSGLEIVPVEWPHAAAVETLPIHHRDPFDRLLIAQAQLEEYSIVSADRVFRRYDVRVIW